MPVFDVGFSPSQHKSSRPGYNGTSLQAFFAAFPDDDACLAHVFRVRFGSDPQCRRCGGRGRWRRHAVQKHYFHPCGGILSPMAEIVFSRSRIPLQLWFYAMLHIANSAESIAVPFLARQIGISERSAFRMSHRLRYHLAALDDNAMIGGAGEMVMARLVKVLRISNPQRNVQNSAMVLLLSDTQRVNATVMIHPRQKSLRSVIAQKTGPGSIIGTDCYWTHRALSNYRSGKPIATFLPLHYQDRLPSENLNHGFMQYFHLSFADQFRGVSREHAWLYFKEYEFRYNRRRCSEQIFGDMTARFPAFDTDSLQRLEAHHFIRAPGAEL